jgi:SAM-dependent methyltransferase
MDTVGEQYATRMAARLAAMAAEGRNQHGEATFCAALPEPGARVLDAGCGTGRVAIRLAELGFDCVGVDHDESMLAVARRTPGIEWVQGDLATWTSVGDFDLVVAAGNVVPLVADPPAVLARLAQHARPGGLVVCGFGLTERHLPPGAPQLSLADYDAWCAAAGLHLQARYGSWDAAEFDGGYAVSVLRAAAPDSPRPAQ